MAEEFSAEFDPKDLGQLLKDARDFDRQFYTAFRKRLRVAGESGVKDVQAHILAGPSKQTKHSLRFGLAAGTSVSIRGGALAGISVTTTGSKLPPAKKPLVLAYNKRTFRHPLFGGQVWKEQAGHPVFYPVLDRHRPQMAAGAEQALVDASRTIRAGEVSR